MYVSQITVILYIINLEYVCCFVHRKAVEEAKDPELQGIAVYVAQDCTGKRDY